MSSPTLSIIIVSWNVCELLRACLTSIEATKGELDVEVIVVDSASHDETVTMVGRDFPSVNLLAQPINVGFPRGNNIGLDAATGAYLLLLNPDTEVRPNALQAMLAAFEQTPQTGMLGPELLNSDGSHQSSRRRFPSTLTGLFESTWLQPYAPKKVLADYYVLDSADNQRVEVDWVNGACMLTSRRVIDKVGGMDAAYFMYSEELDWCRRIKDAGFRVFYDPSAQILHHVGKSSEQAVTHRHINFNRAKLRYFRKFHGWGAYAFLRFVLIKQFLWQLLLEAGKWVVGSRRELRRQRIGAYLRVLRSGLTAAGFER